MEQAEIENKIKSISSELGLFQLNYFKAKAEQDKKIKDLEDSILKFLPQDTNKLWQEITKLQQKIQVIDYNLNYRLKEKEVERAEKEKAEKPKKFWDWLK